MPPLYTSLYESHDLLLNKRRAEVLAQEETHKKKRLLETCYDDLTELPALSSFIQIRDAMEACSKTRTPLSDSDDGGDAQTPGNVQQKRNGFERMQRCRMALDALDQGGWKRSYHQRLFHEAYIAACARPFWKLDPPGSLVNSSI